MRPDRVFLVVAAGFGVALCAATPPGDDKDAIPHLSRIHPLATGALAYPSEGDAIPTALLRVHPGGHPTAASRHDRAAFLDLFEVPLRPDERSPGNRAAHYPPVAFAAQAVGMRIGLVLDLSPAGLVYAARAGNLLAWLALGWAALRIIPIRRWALFALALTPTVLFQASTLGADPTTNAMGFLFVALSLRAILTERPRMTPREGASLLAAAALLGLSKPGYWALAGLVALIPRERFSGAGQRAAFALALAVAILLPGLAWQIHVWGVGLPPRFDFTDPGAQLGRIQAEPLRFLWILVSSLAGQLPHLLASGFWMQLHHHVALPHALLLAQPFVLAALCAADGPDPRRVTPTLRIACTVLFALCVATIATLAYLYWNHPGADAIAGVHGRYFMPAAPLLLVAIPGVRSLVPRWLAPALALGFSLASLAAAVAALFRRYF